MVGLAVVAEGAGVLEQVVVGARRASRPRRSRSSWSRRTSRRRRRPTMPGRRPFQLGAVRVGAVLEQEDALGAAVRRRSARPRRRCGRRCGRAPRRAACARSALRSKSSNDMQRSSRLQSTKTGSRARADDRERRGHERVGGAEDLLARGRRRSRARRAPRRVQPPVATEPRPCRSAQAASKRRGHLALGPALGEHDLVPELVEPGQVAAVEADRELAVVSGGQRSRWASDARGRLLRSEGRIVRPAA